MSQQAKASEIILRRYDILNREVMSWAIIVIGSDGLLAICSDYGNYAHKWPTQGWGEGDFREFLLTIDVWYYLSSKLSTCSHYDGEATVRRIREDILQGRRSGCYDREFARSEWDLFESWREDLQSVIGFHNWYMETRIDCAGELAEHTYDPRLTGLWQHIWPSFCALLRTELAAEAA